MGTVITDKHGRKYYVPTKEERGEMNTRNRNILGMMALGGFVGFFTAVGVTTIFGIKESSWPIFLSLATSLSFLIGGALNQRLRDGHWL
jgi:hypothetical protein